MDQRPPFEWGLITAASDWFLRSPKRGLLSGDRLYLAHQQNLIEEEQRIEQEIVDRLSGDAVAEVSVSPEDLVTIFRFDSGTQFWVFTSIRASSI
jgi:hypothetical protein